MSSWVGSSSSKSYLHPIMERENLEVRTGCRAKRLLFDNEKRCIGAEYIGEDLFHAIQVGARREVILSCGSIDDPKLLMLSGIGPAEHLREFGIDVLVDLASDADGFAALASYVVPDGTALTTLSVADTGALASRDVAGVNFRADITSDLLERLAEMVVSGRIVAPPITRVELEDAPALNRNGHAGGKTVITL